MRLACAHTHTGAGLQVAARGPRLQSPTTLSSSLPHLALLFHHYHPFKYVEDRSKGTMRDMYMMWVSLCMYVVPKGGRGRRWIHRGRWHQNRVHCKQSAAKSSARLQGRAQLADAEPPITFTGGGLEGFSCGLSPPGCLPMGFPSLEASVCAVRNRNR